MPGMPETLCAGAASAATLPRVNNLLLYLATVAIWGSSWLGIKLQLGVVPPEVSVLYRFVVAAVLLLAWCRFRGLRLRFTWRQHVAMALVGIPLFSLNYVIFYIATAYLTSGLVAVTFSTILIMNILFGAVLIGAPIRPRVAIGALFGLAGLSLVFWPDLAAFDTGSNGLIGLGLSLIATALASLGNVASARNQKVGIPVVQGNAIGMAYGALCTLIVILLRGTPFVFDPSPLYVSGVLYLAIVASIFGFGCYLTLLGRIGADRAAYTSVVFPLVALGLSTVFENYEWTKLALAGVALIVAGNVIVLARIGRRSPAPA
jgi:drug/metabolite transporter (DMT)-like permease